jgi:hypothetical protein
LFLTKKTNVAAICFGFVGELNYGVTTSSISYNGVMSIKKGIHQWMPF